MRWTEEVLQEAIEVLWSTDDMTEARRLLSVLYGEEVSADALGKAFKRNGLNPPSSYLGEGGDSEDIHKAESKVDKDDYESLEPKQVEGWRINWDKGYHEFKWCLTTYNITFDEMEDVLVMYSSHEAGLNMTKKELARFFQSKGKPWADENFLKWMFSTIGYSKSLFPNPPHKMFADEESVRKSAYNRRDGLVKGKFQAKIIKEQSRRLLKMEEKFQGLTKSISLADKTLEESEIKRIDYRGVDPADGFRCLIIPVCDLHNGKKVSIQNFTKPQNVFNQDVYWRRMENFCSIIKKHAESVGYDYYNRVHIAGLGDYFEALLLNMRQGHHINSDAYGGAQYRAVINGWKAIIDTVYESFHADFTSIIQGGNHDRLTEHKHPNSEEVLAFQMVEHLRDYYRDHTSLDIGFGSAVVSIMLENGVNLLCTHGHHKKIQREKDFANFIQVHGFKDAKRYVIEQGHFHNTYVITGYNFRAYGNASFCGDDGYNLHKLSVGAPPELMMVETTDNHDVSIGPYNLNFDIG